MTFWLLFKIIKFFSTISATLAQVKTTSLDLQAINHNGLALQREFCFGG